MSASLALPGLARVRRVYFFCALALVLLVAVASFVRHDGPVLRNIASWFALATFAVSLVSLRAGLVATVLLLTLSPALHQQIEALTGTRLIAWTYPGVDGCVGFLAASLLRGGVGMVRPTLEEFPAGVLLTLQTWIALSAAVAVGRNLFQSASEFSWRGLASHAWMLRRIGLQNDYLPLQDLYYVTVALIVLFTVLGLARRDGDRIVRSIAWSVLAGAVVNASFAFWQVTTRRGWFRDPPNFEVNAFWPDLHVFAAFMVVAMATGYGLLVGRSLSRIQTAGVVIAALTASAGLYFSGSRATLVIVCIVLFAVIVWAVWARRGHERAIALALGLSVVASVYWLFERGYRGVSFASIQALLDATDSGSLSRALAHRPEIWTSALNMYSQFPFFGLGQGEFVRLSSIPEFAQSNVLAALGGGGAHNYFLQTFVELGPVGLGILLLIAIPASRLGTQNFRLVSFYALIGVAVGNLYAHGLLTREMLMLAAIFSATYFAEAQHLCGPSWRPLAPATIRTATAVLLVLATLALLEATLSFGKFPFVYGQRCFQERALTWDNWTEGFLRVPAPAVATGVNLVLANDRRDASRRPLRVDVAVVDESGAVLSEHAVTFAGVFEESQSLALTLDPADGKKRFVLLRPSHCYVPLNLGRGQDGRHLGVRVRSLQYTPAAS